MSDLYIKKLEAHCAALEDKLSRFFPLTVKQDIIRDSVTHWNYYIGEIRVASIVETHLEDFETTRTTPSFQLIVMTKALRPDLDSLPCDTKEIAERLLIAHLSGASCRSNINLAPQY